MPNGIEFKLAGDGKEVVNEFRKVLAEQQKNVRALEKMSEAARNSTDTTKRGMQGARGEIRSATADVGTFVSKFAGIGSVIGGVLSLAQSLRSELESARQRDAVAAAANRDFVGNVQAVRRNFKGDESLPNDQLQARIQATAKNVGVDPNLVAGALSTAVSARGERSGADALNAVEQAARFTKDPGEIATLSGALLDIQNVGGVDDARGAGGFLQAVGSRSRTTDIGRLAANIRGITGAARLDPTGGVEAGGELFALFSTLLNDSNGDVAKTATQKFARTVRDFVPQDTAKDALGEFDVPANQRAAFSQAAGTFARRDVLRQSPELQRAFLAAYGTDESRAAVESLIGGGAETEALVRGVRAAVPSPSAPGLARRFDAEVQRIRGGGAGRPPRNSGVVPR